MKYFLSLLLIIFLIHGAYPINALAQSDESWETQQIQRSSQSQQNLPSGTFTLPNNVSSDVFVKDLMDQGLLNPINDASSINLFQSICSSVHISSLNQNLNTFCEIIVASEICQAIEDKDDLLQCNDFSRSKSLNPIEFLAGCTEGLFDSLREILSFVWEIIKVIGKTFLSPIDTATQAVRQQAEYLNSVKLYLQTEYDRAYQEANFPKGYNAMKEVASGVALMLIKTLSDALYQGYQQFGCLNAKARTDAICKVAGELFIPPAVAINLFKVGIRGIRTVDKLDTFISNQKRRLRPTNDLISRQRSAETILERPLSPREARAVQAAHEIGEGQLGRDGTLAGIGNYTDQQLRDKARILREAGFSRDERRRLIESGVVGNGIFEDLFQNLVKNFAKAEEAEDGYNIEKLNSVQKSIIKNTYYQYLRGGLDEMGVRGKLEEARDARLFSTNQIDQIARTMSETKTENLLLLRGREREGGRCKYRPTTGRYKYRPTTGRSYMAERKNTRTKRGTCGKIYWRTPHPQNT